MADFLLHAHHYSYLTALRLGVCSVNRIIENEVDDNLSQGDDYQTDDRVNDCLSCPFGTLGAAAAGNIAEATDDNHDYGDGADYD